MQNYKPKPLVLFMESNFIPRLRSEEDITTPHLANYHSIIIPFHKASSSTDLVDDWAFLYIVPSENTAFCLDGKATETHNRTGLSDNDQTTLCPLLKRWILLNSGVQLNFNTISCLSKFGLLHHESLISDFDTGLFTIIAIRFVLYRCPITFKNSNMYVFRLHLAHQLLQCDGKDIMFV
jgi:hypothetical protein